MPGERMTDLKWKRLEQAEDAAEGAAENLRALTTDGRDNDEGEIEEDLHYIVEDLQAALSTVRWVIRRIR